MESRRKLVTMILKYVKYIMCLFFHKNVFLLGADYFTLVLEYADSGTLIAYLAMYFSELNWNDKRHLALQLTSAVEFLHGKNIIHRDLVYIFVPFYFI